ncbi:MAG: hypothetical protein AAFR46_00865 [Pseudomonadota bacterium]
MSAPDAPAAAPPLRYFAIIAAMRTGSNLLQRTLAQFPDLLCHGELFNPSFVGQPGRSAFEGISRAARDADPLALIDRMIARAGSQLPGFRIFDDHDPRVLAHVAQDPGCARILLDRDPVESFVSLLIARETGQWMLTSKGRRKSAKVHVDSGALAAFCAARDAARHGFLQQMRTAGCSAFHLRFEELGELALINGLGRHLGSAHRLSRIAPTLLRQNPGPLAAHVINPEAVASAAKGQRPQGSPAMPALQGARLAPAAGLLFVPIPGAQEARITAWLERLAVEGEPGQPPALRATLSQRGIEAGLRRGEIRLAVTATRHPMARIYDVFMSRFVRPRGKGFPRIRSALVREYGLALPDTEPANSADRAGLEARGYDLAAHRRGFEVFLDFLALNLAGRTTIRIDPLWTPQVTHLAQISTWLPLRRVLGPDLAGTAALLRAELGLTGSEAALAGQPDPLFALAETWTPGLAARVARLYAQDHARLGYDPNICPDP